MARKLFAAFLLAFGAVCARASQLLAANLFWETSGFTGELLGPNYFNSDIATGAQLPTSGDVLNVGNTGTANLSTPALIEVQKLRVGHSQLTGYNGAGTVNVSNGAQLNLTVGAAGAANASLWVGNVQNGTLNIDGAGTSVTSARLIIIGYGNNVNRTGTVNITNGGSLIATEGNITMGEGTGTNKNGVQGHLNVSDGTVSVLDGGADIIVGNNNAVCTVTQSGGLIQVADRIMIGAGGSTGSSYTMTGGTTTTQSGSVLVGRGAVVEADPVTVDAGSIDATLNISGDAVLNVGLRLNVGSTDLNAHPATGAKVNQSGGTVNIASDLRVGDANSNNSTYNLSGGTINSALGGIVGRQGIAVFNHTGGVANFNGALRVGDRDAAAFTNNNGLYKISAGELNAGANNGGSGLAIATLGTGEFRVVGDDASIDILGSLDVGNNVEGVGTLAFEFETGDLLSTINVVNNATFAAGSKLVLDSSLASPTATTYDLLTAVDIIDNGLVFQAPAGWTTQIVAGGNGEILRAVAPGGPAEDADFDADGDVDGQDFLTWQRGLGGPGPLANGDANGDNTVNAADLDVWQGQFGAPSVAAVSAVPEPGSLVLLMSAIGLFSAARGRAHKA